MIIAARKSKREIEKKISEKLTKCRKARGNFMTLVQFWALTKASQIFLINEMKRLSTKKLKDELYSLCTLKKLHHEDSIIIL